MAVKACKLDGKPGWQWGDGTCHTYDADSAGGSAVAKAKAMKEAVKPKTGTNGGENMDGQVKI